MSIVEGGKARSAKQDGTSVPLRTCVICRAKLPKPELARHVCPPPPDTVEGAGEGARRLVPDADQTMPGRGFYVCADEECLRRFAKYQGWRRKCKEVRS